MPLTAKEKMQAYRKRIRQNPEKDEEVKKKDRERKEKQRCRMKDDQKAVERVKNRQRVAKHRAKQRANAPKRRAHGQILTENLFRLPFRSPQTLGKAKRRVAAALPNSPSKKRAVVTALANDVGIPLKNTKTDSDNRRNEEETDQKVITFYLNTSSMCAGQKDTCIIRGTGKEKKTVQKQYMLTTLKEAHAMYLEANKDHPVSFSKFADLRPPQVQLQGQIPHNSCLCKYHENVRLLLQALHKAGLDVPTDFRTFISTAVCDQEQENCMSGNCTLCPGIDHLAPPPAIAAHQITWHQWSLMLARIGKKKVEGTVQSCFEELKEQLPYFLQHTFVKRVQAEEFQTERDSVKDDASKVVIQVDFAENFTTKNQNEIQSAYWAYSQVTLFTVCAWEQSGVHSMVIVSDHMNHDKYAVNVFLRKILHWLDNEVRHFDEVVVFSDGAAQQFKQRFLLCSLTLLERNIAWNFFATSHGKGPVDGIGGTAKRAVAKEVMSENAEVQSSEEFVRVAQEKCPNITFLLVPKQSILEKGPEFDKCFQDVRAVPCIKKMHKFVVKGPYRMTAQAHAKSSASMTHSFRERKDDKGDKAEDNQQRNDDRDVEEDNQEEDGQERKDDKDYIIEDDQQRNDDRDVEEDNGEEDGQENKDDKDYIIEDDRQRNDDRDVEEDNREEDGQENKDDKDYIIEDDQQRNDDRDVEEDNREEDGQERKDDKDYIIEEDYQQRNDDRDDISRKDHSEKDEKNNTTEKEGTHVVTESKDDTGSNGCGDMKDISHKWVVVQYTAEKPAKRFIGQVMSVADGKVTVKFLKRSFGKYVWPEVEDVDVVYPSNIVGKVDEPQMNRRGAITFNNLDIIL